MRPLANALLLAACLAAPVGARAQIVADDQSEGGDQTAAEVPAATDDQQPPQDATVDGEVPNAPAPAPQALPEPPPDALWVSPVPELFDLPPPDYPTEALEAAMEGKVVLELAIDAGGAVTDATVVREPGAGLGEAARQALLQAIFDEPPPEGPPVELRRYFYVQEFVLPEAYRPPPPEQPPAELEMADELTAVPALESQVAAVYPSAARDEGLQALVSLQLDVSDTGALDAVTLLDEQPQGWGFGVEAVRAAWQFGFTPAYAGPVPVPVRITYAYHFELEEREVVKAADTPDEGSAIDPEGPVNLAGYVRERGSRKSLTEVEVIIESLDGYSTLTDDLGYFEFRGLPAGTHRVLVAVPGYERYDTEEDILPGQRTDVVFFVRESPTGVNETIVRVKREKKEVARRVIEVETIERIPGTFGDPVKVVQNLPGVSRSPFDFGLLLIRGSGPEDSGAHIDGIRVPQIFHFGGLRSIVTPILLEAVDFYPGGYGPNYGRLTGGILDVRTRNEYEDQIHGLLQADLIDASAAVIGPIRKKGERYPIGGFVVAGRRSYLDIILPALAPNTVDLSKIVFPQWSDLQGKVTLRPNKAHRISALAYWSSDAAARRVEDPSIATEEASQGDFGIRSDFWRVAADWQFRPSDTFENQLNFAVGEDTSKLAAGQYATIEGGTFWWMLRDEATLKFNDNLSLLFGTDVIASAYNLSLIFNDFDVSSFGSDPNSEKEKLTLEDEGFALGVGVFAEAQLAFVDDRVRLFPGIRPDVYTVPDQFTLGSLDPRFSFRVSPDPGRKLDIKGSVGLYHQNPQAYEVLDVTGNTDLQAEESGQVTAGLELQITDFLSLDVQGFYKRLDKLVVFRGGNVTTGGSDGAWGNIGDGHIWGGEAFLRWEDYKRFEGWISLTYQRSKRRDGPDRDFYWYDFDQPFIFDVVASYELPHGFRIGGRWRYVSGNPDTPVRDAIYDSDSDSYIALRGDYNSTRLPDFHQLDIRIDKELTFRRWTLTFYLDLMNVYNRKNPESRVYNFDYTEEDFLYSLPFLPNLGFKAQF